MNLPNNIKELWESEDGVDKMLAFKYMLHNDECLDEVVFHIQTNAYLFRKHVDEFQYGDEKLSDITKECCSIIETTPREIMRKTNCPSMSFILDYLFNYIEDTDGYDINSKKIINVLRKHF